LATSQDSSLQFQKDLSPPKNITIDLFFHQHDEEFKDFSCWANHDMANLEGIAWYIGLYEVTTGQICKLQVELVDNYNLYDPEMDSSTQIPNVCQCNSIINKSDCNKLTGPSQHGGSKKQPCIWNNNTCTPYSLSATSLIGKGIQGIYKNIENTYVGVPTPQNLTHLKYEKSDQYFIENSLPAFSVWYSTPLKGYCDENSEVGINCAYKVKSCEYIDVNNFALTIDDTITYNLIPKDYGVQTLYYGVYETIANSIEEEFKKNKQPCNSTTHPTF
jgi:hypothetical protein